MFGDRVVVPDEFRRSILKQFHRGNPGIVHSKGVCILALNRSRNSGIRQGLKPCATAGKAPPKTTLESWPVPSKPWSRIHIDYVGPVDSGSLLHIRIDRERNQID